MNKTKTEKSAAWYRYPMVWFVFALPACVVVASIWTIVIAHQSAPVLIPTTTQVSESAELVD